MINVDQVLNHPPLVVDYTYDEKDTMLHALATGLGMNALDPEHLRFVHDAQSQPLLALPTLPLVHGWVDMVRDPRRYDPSLGLDPTAVVVGQVELTLHAPTATKGHGTTHTSFVQLVDKGQGRGALVCVRRRVLNETGAELATVDTWLFVRGAGGFGGPSHGGPERTQMPSREPDAVIDQETPENLALLYRLVLGDHNAVHSDPEHATKSGFHRPILHGLATFALSIHGAVRAGTGSLVANAFRLKQAHASFTKPVYPGDRLRTRVWRNGDELLFTTSVPARDVTVVEGGRLLLAAH